MMDKLEFLAFLGVPKATLDKLRDDESSGQPVGSLADDTSFLAGKIPDPAGPMCQIKAVFLPTPYGTLACPATQAEALSLIPILLQAITQARLGSVALEACEQKQIPLLLSLKPFLDSPTKAISSITRHASARSSDQAGTAELAADLVDITQAILDSADDRFHTANKSLAQALRNSALLSLDERAEALKALAEQESKQIDDALEISKGFITLSKAVEDPAALIEPILDLVGKLAKIYVTDDTLKRLATTKKAITDLKLADVANQIQDAMDEINLGSTRLQADEKLLRDKAQHFKALADRAEKNFDKGSSGQFKFSKLNTLEDAVQATQEAAVTSFDKWTSIQLQIAVLRRLLDSRNLIERVTADDSFSAMSRMPKDASFAGNESVLEAMEAEALQSAGRSEEQMKASQALNGQLKSLSDSGLKSLSAAAP